MNFHTLVILSLYCLQYGLSLLQVQGLAILSIILWHSALSLAILKLLQVTIGLLMSPGQDFLGCDIVDHGIDRYRYNKMTGTLKQVSTPWSSLEPNVERNNSLATHAQSLDQDIPISKFNCCRAKVCLNRTDSEKCKVCCFPWQRSYQSDSPYAIPNDDLLYLSVNGNLEDLSGSILSELYQQSWTPMSRFPTRFQKNVVIVEDEADSANPAGHVPPVDGDSLEPGTCSGAVAWAHSFYNRNDDDQYQDVRAIQPAARSSSLANYL